jgi:hypothetical protein
MAGIFNALWEPLYFSPITLWTLLLHLVWTKGNTIDGHIQLFFVGYFVQEVYASKMGKI